MSASRRMRRSVRSVVAAGLLALAAVVVTVAVVTDTAVEVSAVLALLAGVTSARIIYTEVTETRGEAARQRAELAKDFGATITKTHAEHAEFTALMTTRVADLDQAVRQLHGTVRLADRRAEQAEAALARESKRADQAQERLLVLLAEVQQGAAAEDSVEEDSVPETADLPTVVDLLAWEDYTEAAVAGNLRRRA